jgi:CubicO group peptidase (beta-lactamase class C family)
MPYLSRIIGIHHVMKIWLVLVLSCFVVLTSRAQSDTKEPLSDALLYIDAWLEAQQAYEHLPGMSVGIVKDQELIWSKGYGFADVKKKTPANAETVYKISSISKLFTSIAIMQLYEQGKLRLDDSLSAILPERKIRQQFTDSGPITIRSLLTHSSGLPRESDFPYWTGPDFKFPSKQEFHEKLDQQETLYPASTYFQYSNLGMALLGEIIEKISGKSYEAYIHENILKPLRLTSTYPDSPEGLADGKHATGYSSLSRQGTRDVVAPFNAGALQAATGYSSSVHDLAQFAAWQFRLVSNGGKEILSAPTLKEMQRVQWVDPDGAVQWGLGFMVFQNNGHMLTGHWGTCPGYRSLIVMDPEEKLAVIILINAGENPWKYANHIRKILLQGEKEKRFKPGPMDPEQYVGTYNAQPYSSEKKVLSWYGNLAVLELPSENPLEDMTLLKHVSGDVFRRIRRDDALGEEIRFDRDDKTGKVYRMWRHSNYSVRIK